MGRQMHIKDKHAKAIEAIARLEAENRELRAKLETVRAETIERCAKTVNAALLQFEDIDGPRQTAVAAIRSGHD